MSKDKQLDRQNADATQIPMFKWNGVFWVVVYFYFSNKASEKSITHCQKNERKVFVSYLLPFPVLQILIADDSALTLGHVTHFKPWRQTETLIP